MRELVRLAALSVTQPAPRVVTPLEARDLRLQAARDDWNLIPANAGTEALYSFLAAHPGGTEFAEMAQHRLDRLDAPHVRAALGQGLDASLGYTGPRFALGDEFQYQLVDMLTQLVVRTYTRRVTSIENDTVSLNDGDIAYTLLGATLRDNFGRYEPAFAGQPAEFQIGRTWSSRAMQTASRNRRQYRLDTESRIVGVERITVPAGTFQTYVVEAVQYISGGSEVEVQQRRVWIDPRYGVPIRSEVMQRRNLVIERSERRELIALKAERASR